MIRRHALGAVVSALALAVPATLVAPAAPSAQAAPVGPGAPLRAYPEPSEDQELPTEWEGYSCSQAFAGTVTLADGSTKEVMVTASHCVTDVFGEGRDVNPVLYAPKTWGDQLIAHRDQYSVWALEDIHTVEDFLYFELNAPDWATAELAPGTDMTNVTTSVDHYGHQRSTPVALTGVRDYPDLAPYEVSTDNFGEPICKDGQRSARTCGVQLFRASESVVHWGLWYESGDSGGINYDPNNGEVIGITSMGIGPLGRAQKADRALQEAYGIPDGQVNERFTLPENYAPHDGDFRTVKQENDAYNEWAVANDQPPVVDYKEQFAQDRAAVEADLHAGNWEALPHHAEVLPESAVHAATQQLLGL